MGFPIAASFGRLNFRHISRAGAGTGAGKRLARSEAAGGLCFAAAAAEVDGAVLAVSDVSRH